MSEVNPELDDVPAPPPVAGSAAELSDFTERLARALFGDHVDSGSCTAVVKHDVTDGRVSAEGELRYVFDVVATPPNLKFTVGANRLLDMAVANERMRKCTLTDARSASGSGITQEMDALFYFLGWMSVQEQSTLEALPRAGVARALLHNLYDERQLNVSEAFLSYGSNAYLIPRLAHLCGHDHYNVTSIDLPEVRGTVAGDDSVPKAVIRLAACFYAHCVDESEREAALAAWALGLVAGLTVHGHTDEAGWMRRVLRSAKFKRASGYYSETAEVFEVWDGRMTGKCCRARLYTRALMVMGLCTVAGQRVAPTSVLQLQASAPHFEAALSTSGFRDELLAWADELGGLINVGIKAGGAQHVRVAVSEYLSNLHADRHLEGEVIFPWWYIEPSPILPRHVLRDLDIGGYGRVHTMERFEGEVHDDHLSATAAQDPLWLRKSGLYYLFNESYNPLNGLNQFVGVLDRDTYFHGQASQVTLAGTAWRRPDCAVPTSYEGNDVRGVTFYRMERAPFNLSGPKIDSSFTYHSVRRGVHHGSIGPGRDRFIPRYAKKALLDLLVKGLPMTKVHYWNIFFEEGAIEKQTVTAASVARMVTGDKFTVAVRARAPNRRKAGPITGVDASPADGGTETEDISRFVIPDSSSLSGFKAFLSDFDQLDQLYDKYGGLARTDVGDESPRIYAFTQLLGVNAMQFGASVDAIIKRIVDKPELPDEDALHSILTQFILDNALSPTTDVYRFNEALGDALRAEG